MSSANKAVPTGGARGQFSVQVFKILGQNHNFSNNDKKIFGKTRIFRAVMRKIWAKPGIAVTWIKKRF